MTRRSRLDRRSFLQWLLASPLLASPGLPAREEKHLVDGLTAADVAGTLDRQRVSDAAQAIDVFDFERLAAERLPPAHFGYVASAAGDDSTMAANAEAIAKVRLRLRRLVGVGEVDTGVDLFGQSFSAPIFLCPLGSLGAMHPEGEKAVARAAGAHRVPMALSTFSSNPIEPVNTAFGQPVWFQLYVMPTWRGTTDLIRRAEGDGATVMMITVDTPKRVLRERGERFSRADDRDCTACHNESRGQTRHKPMAAGMVTKAPRELWPSTINWRVIERIRAMTQMQIVIKGLETREDAELALSLGVDGILVSNHGGRGIHASRGTLDCLTEVLEGAGELPVLIDSGFRRGTDVFKALALGARAVGVGRPYAWGLAAFGEAGVSRVIELLTEELKIAMTQAGAGRVADISRRMIVV